MRNRRAVRQRADVALAAALLVATLLLIPIRPLLAEESPVVVGAGSPITVLHQNGRGETITPSQVNGSDYLPVDDLSLLYSAGKYWRPDILKMTLRIGDHRVKLTADNKNVVIDDRVIRLRDAVLYRSGTLFVPMQLVTEVLPRVVDSYPISWEAGSATLIFGSARNSILGVRANVLTDGIELVVRPSGPSNFEERERADGDFEVRFPGTRIPDQPLPVIDDTLLVESLGWLAEGDTSVLVISPSDSLADWKITREGRPEKVVVRLSSSTIHSGARKGGNDILVLTRPTRKGRGIRKVIIDPGHGGSDSGCVGPAGVMEKQYVLELASALQASLSKSGIPAELTREDDRELALAERTAFANARNGDLLISLHLNSSRTGEMAGAEVYVHVPGSGSRARIAAAVDDAKERYQQELAGGVLDQELRFVPWGAVQSAHRSRSASVARQVQRELAAVDGLASRGVHEGPIAVLAGANMPAILVEIGFLSNPGEESFLAAEGTVDRIADRMARAVKNWAAGGGS